MPGGGGSLTRGLPPTAVEGSSPSPPPIPPTLGGGEVDGTAFQDLPGLVWDRSLGIAMIGNFPVGGRLSLFLPAWQRLTSDRFVLEVVRQGYSLPFVNIPPLSRIPVETPLPRLRLKREALWEEVASLLTKGAVETVQLSQDQGGFYSHYFLATKRTGGFRPILNLRGLNTYLRVSKFRMETLSSIIQGLHPGWWMVSLDLKDAYLHVPIHPSHWRYLRFALRNAAGELIVYQWKVLPFGLATAPRVFTKILAPVAAHLHMQGCLMYPYIDDIFHAEASFLQACRTRDTSLRCHFMLGFIVNLAKSALVPSQVLLHLGAMIDTARGILFPSPPRLEAIVHAAQELLSLTQVSARYLRHVIGLLASCHSLVPLCMFHLRPLSILLRDHFDMRFDQPTKLIPLSSPVVRSSLEFWSQRELVSQGVPLRPPTPSHVLTTDASNFGWGAVCGPLSARGVWSNDHVGLHINFLELETVFLALKTFQRWLCGTHVLVQTDNTTVMHYLNRLGGTRSRSLD